MCLILAYLSVVFFVLIVLLCATGAIMTYISDKKQQKYLDKHVPDWRERSKYY